MRQKVTDMTFAFDPPPLLKSRDRVGILGTFRNLFRFRETSLGFDPPSSSGHMYNFFEVQIVLNKKSCYSFLVQSTSHSELPWGDCEIINGA